MDKFTKTVYDMLNEVNLQGKSEGKSVVDIAKKHNTTADEINKQVEMGKKVEMEHTKDKDLAEKIAMDHLWEIPDYYTRLKKMEKQASVKESMTSGSVMGGSIPGQTAMVPGGSDWYAPGDARMPKILGMMRRTFPENTWLKSQKASKKKDKNAKGRKK